MRTEEWAKQKLISLGWEVDVIEYTKPHSGFMCIEGGYFCQLSTDEDDFELLDNLKTEGIFGNIMGSGIILALYKDDFISLINKIPNKPINHE